MPILPSGAADRIQKLRQKIVAASDLPKGAAASDVTDATEGRVWRTVDGCCGGGGTQLKLAFIAAGDLCPSGYDLCVTPDDPFTLTLFSPQIPVGTVIIITNLAGEDVTYSLGTVISGDIPTPTYSGSVQANGGSVTSTVDTGMNITGMTSHF
jgi:hypothetical protein